jgi:hypothetical protein
LFLAALSPAFAGGLLGDAVEGLCGNCGAGRALDDAHREFKEAVPSYGDVEEGVSGGVRNLTQEATVETLGPVLYSMIVGSRDDALRGGTSRIPPHIYNELAPSFMPEFLDRVSYRVGQGGELTLQANSFRFGDRSAITLDHVIVFRSGSDADDLWLWAHELSHVIQVERSGLMDFAKRYVRDHQAMEDEANAIADDFVSRRQVVSQAFPSPQPIIDRCMALLGACRVAPGPVGSPCFCVTFNGEQHHGQRQ